MTRTTGTFLEISIASIFFAVVIFPVLVTSQDDCDPRFRYDDSGIGSQTHIRAFGTGDKWGQLKRLSPDYNYVVISPLQISGTGGTFMRAPNVVGFYPEYNRWTELYKGRKERYIGLCGSPEAKLEHLEPVLFQSTAEQDQFRKLMDNLVKDNRDFFNLLQPLYKKYSWAFPTGEFRRTDGVLVDPRTNTTISYNGFYYHDGYFYPSSHGSPSEQHSPFFTGFYCQRWEKSTPDDLRCGLTLIEESDNVIPLCRYRTNSTCYKQTTYTEEEEDFFAEEWKIGTRTYFGYKKQKNVSEAKAKCRENSADLLAFTMDANENKEIMKAAKEYYGMLTKTPVHQASSYILTSGEFGPPSPTSNVISRELTFNTTNTKYSEGSYYSGHGFNFQAIWWAYLPVFENEDLIDGDGTSSKHTAGIPHTCCAYTQNAGLMPIHCTMYGYFMCSRDQYPWEKEDVPRNKTLQCACGEEQTVSGNDGKVEQPWVALLYFRFRAFSREVPALDFKTCAGTVINNKMILTSASCVLNKAIAMIKNGATIKAATADKVIIALNTKTQKSGVPNDKPLMLSGTVSLVHPEFFKHYKTGDTKNLDWAENIALVKIDEKHTLDFVGNSDIKIRPACVADIGEQILNKLYGKKVNVTGWSGEKDGNMRTYKSEFVNIDECKRFENQQSGDFTYKITRTSLCHEVAGKTYSLTPKDGGAPMYVQHPEEKWRLIGTASSHSAIGASKFLSLFTDVAAFANFINYQSREDGAEWCKN